MNVFRGSLLLLLCWNAYGQVDVREFSDHVSIQIDQGPATTFSFGPTVTKPFLSPIYDSDGTAVSRQWPMNPQPGERHDHIHHRGIWFAHSSVNGIDFWNSDPSYHSDHMGHIDVTKIYRAVGGKDSGTVGASMEWRDPANNVLMDERRIMVFRSGDPRIIDFDITLTARQPIVFGDDKDGVFGIRLAPELEEPAGDAPAAPPRTGTITSSNGCTHESGCWGKQADWTDVSGTVHGHAVGIAILDHPENPRHPTYWHVRGYGLLAANIFGVKAFTKGASGDGVLKLERGNTLRFRYRVVIHGGDAQAAHIDRLYRAYAEH